MQIRSMRGRLALLFTLSTAALTLVACAALILYARYAAERRAAALLDSTLSKIVADLNESAPHLDTADLSADVGTEGMALQLLEPSGRILFATRRSLPDLRYASAETWRTKKGRFGEKLVVVGLPWAATRATLRRQSAMLSVLGLFVVAVTSGGAWLLVGRTLAPIGRLARTVDAAADDLDVSLAPSSDDAEILGLVATLNGLLRRIAATAEAKGRFHAAASHELRTPLQALCGHLELGLSRPRTNEEYRSIVAEADVQAQRLAALARDLLLLHQLDSGPAAPGVDVDIRHAVELAVNTVAATAAARDVKVTVRVAPDTSVTAPQVQIEILVRNLIDNAVRYASEGSMITIDGEPREGGPQLRVHNACAIPAGWEAERRFEPFYRPDVVRGPSNGGSGLGLAICNAIAENNGWKLGLRADGDGVTATVDFGARPC